VEKLPEVPFENANAFKAYEFQHFSSRVPSKDMESIRICSMCIRGRCSYISCSQSNSSSCSDDGNEAASDDDWGT
jgi:hypothetical protein